MKGADTNVIIRYIVEDDHAQTRQAARIIEAAARDQQPLFVSLPVVCEIAWVLTAAYRLPRTSAANALQAVVDSGSFTVEREEWVQESLDRYRTGRAGFADYLIGVVAREHGCEEVYTFDRRLRGAQGFRVL